ncbi:hypothetical protein DPMN_130484 [Dreissena polymorpha]|uniref:Uncharacterized protein n=1 Tax=Dreissena polymorpha TaxID=45954 RepID=A0A9D4H302_DREPO|nr:hypothetical protein DPMN_130484 [Dreissena polymorpha]
MDVASAPSGLVATLVSDGIKPMEGKDLQYHSSPEMLHVLNIQLICLTENF